jgi:hypothetical protein
VEHLPEQWRLFIDASTNSLKAVLLHNGKEYPSVPVFYSTEVRESYEIVAKVLQIIRYDDYKWFICGDLKILSITLGQKPGYSKYTCFICEWDSRADEFHWTNKQWTIRSNWIDEKKSVIRPNLVDFDKVLIPPLHIKLGIMSQFVKQLAKRKDNEAFKYICKKFPKIRMAKLQMGIFVGPQIRKLMNDDEYETIPGVHERVCTSIQSKLIASTCACDFIQISTIHRPSQWPAQF